MGCLKLTYQNQERALEVNPFFLEKGLGKKGYADKKYVSAYRYGFNGMEKDDEVKGNGNSYDFGARMYDPRIGRWLSLDPLASKYPFASPYNFVLNTPIQAIDPDGRKVVFANEKEANRVANDLNAIYRSKYDIKTNPFKVVTDVDTYTFLGITFWTTTTITIEPSDQFGWDTDMYTRGMYRIMAMEEEIDVWMVDRDPSFGRSLDNRIEVSKNATNFAKDTDNKNWTVGGIVLHELLYHYDALGIVQFDNLVEKSDKQSTEEKYEDAGDAANTMRTYYVLKTGDPHAPQPYLDPNSIGDGSNFIKIPKEEGSVIDAAIEASGKEKVSKP